MISDATVPSEPEINGFDLAFVVDTTGSMGGLIAQARQDMLRTIAELAAVAQVQLRVGVVEYRDHPPQESTFVTRVHPLTSDLSTAQQYIAGLQAVGGGDGPEAVLDGAVAAALELDWRPHARRVAILVGDAPPHGVGATGDGFRNGCPCGETVASTTAHLENARVILYAIGLQPGVADSFGQLSGWSGGEYFASQGRSGGTSEAIERIKTLLSREFGDVEFDRCVLREITAHRGANSEMLTLDELAAQMGTSRPTVAASMSRLGSRNLLSA